MPYNANSDLPEAVRSALPDDALSVWRSAYNSAHKRTADTSMSAAIAWTAVRNSGYSPSSDGKWVLKHADPDSPSPARLDQRAANYAPATDLSASCATCVYFSPGHYDFSGSCSRVGGGPIRPDYTCDLYEPSEEVAQAQMTQTFTLHKFEESRGLAFGWANVAMNRDGTEVIDAHNESIPVEELEEAAYQFALHFRDGGEMHVGQAKASLVESVIFTAEKKEAMGIPSDLIPDGAWWVGLQIHDPELRKQVADGTYRAFSIQGAATLEEVEDA